MTKTRSLVYVQNGDRRGNSEARARAAERIGWKVIRVNAFPEENCLDHLARGIRRRCGWGTPHPANVAVLRVVGESKASVLWVDKGLNVEGDTLIAARTASPGIRLLHYTPDDSRIKANFSVPLRRALELYDVCATTKANNVDWMKAAGARAVRLVGKSYDPELHRPPESTEVDVSLANRAVFVGSWERERAATVKTVALAGVPVTVFSEWTQWRSLVGLPGFELRPRACFESEYARVLGSAGVALCFLRKAADDQVTQRSVEIPACGGLMVAERTEAHEALFESETEALYFSSNEECVAQCRRALADTHLNRRVREAAHRRCSSSGYRNDDVVGRLLEELTAGEGPAP